MGAYPFPKRRRDASSRREGGVAADEALRPFERGERPAARRDGQLDEGSAPANVDRTNRAHPPDFINIKVEELVGDRPFDDLDKFITQDELRALSEQYKRVAGFSLSDVGQCVTTTSVVVPAKAGTQ